MKIFGWHEIITVDNTDIEIYVGERWYGIDADDGMHFKRLKTGIIVDETQPQN